jgi:hypothetical protein
MARATVKPDMQEARLSDSMFDDWKVVIQDRGQKITWGEDNGETPLFVGTFLGTEIVNLGDDDGDDILDKATAALFVDSDGVKFWSWCPFAINKAIEDGTILYEDTVMIRYTGTVATKRGLNPAKTFEIRVKPRV